MSLWEAGDLVPFVVVLKHTAVDATYCLHTLPVTQVMLDVQTVVRRSLYISVTQVNALRGQ